MSNSKYNEVEYDTGDIVRLRSGGPLMTIKEINNDILSCRWFNSDNALNSAEFNKDEIYFEIGTCEDRTTNTDEEYESDDYEQDDYDQYVHSGESSQDDDGYRPWYPESGWDQDEYNDKGIGWH